MKWAFKVGFAGKEPVDDFLLLPTPAFAWFNAGINKIWSIGIKWGYWAIYASLAHYEPDDANV